MASSTSNLDLISSSQASKEITANALFDASSVSSLFGRRASTTSALTWGYYGGVVVVGNTPTAVANGTLALTANLVNYIEYNRTTGALASNTAGWTATYDRVYAITCGASTITSYVDWRFQGIGAPITAYPMTYIGTWNASTNTPTLAGGTGTKGYLYKVSVSGTQDLGNGSTLFTANDSVVYNGATWDKLEGGITSAEVVAALGFTPENVANKNAASGYVGKDANSNAAANSLLAGYATTATAAGTTTLTVASAQQQFFTGTTTQTVVMPLLSALVDGQSWKIDNDSTGAVTVNANATDAGTATQLPVVLAGGAYVFVTRTSATTWDVAGLAADTHAASSKTTPVDADELPLTDSATSFSLKKLTWANLKAVLQFSSPSASKATPVDADAVGLYDSAATTTATKLTWANLKTTLGSTFAALAGSASQAFSATTAAAGTNTTQVATTAYADRLTGGTLAGAFTTLRATTGAAVGGATAGTGGIAFPATAVAVADPNTLDDYEEGTWTPTIAGSTTAGTQTYSLQNGYYTKIGNKVFIEYFITMATKDAATAGDILLVGLPFTSATGGGGVGRGDSWLGHQNLTLSANYYDAYLAMSSAGTVAALSQTGSGQGFANIPVSGLAGSSGFRGSFSYSI